MGAFWKMKDVFTSKTLSIELKTNIFEAACVSILLDGCESWVITEKLASSPNSYATNCYRIMLGIKRLDKVSNKTLYEKVGKHQFTHEIQRRKLRFVDHSLRRDKNDLINKYVLYAPEERHGQRSRGRPHILYHQYIGKLINSDTPPVSDEMRNAEEDRRGWRTFVTDCKPALFAAD